jgi:large subunit ribosomal protein L15
MPLQKRLPKYGFTSRISRTTAQVRLGELNKVTADVVDLQALKDADVVRDDVQRVRVFLSGELSRAVTLKGIPVEQGRPGSHRAAGGKVEAEP